MNSIIFLGGLGTGAVITTVLFLFLIHRLVGCRANVQQFQEASIAELKRRNDIGEQEAGSLRTIEKWCEANWHLTK